ncbi:MAG: MMPL family transporter, partial [Bifidobacteriaceae bacterium]|nr:MMPL family transporter [Bifidobacteriaceae bacterium]
MFLHLSRGVIRHPLATVIVWATLAAGGAGLAVFGVTGEGLFDRVNSGAPEAADSESARADQLIEEGAEESQSVTMSVSGVDLSDAAGAAQVAAELAAVRADLAAIKGVASAPGADGATTFPLVIDPLNPHYFCTDPEIDPAGPAGVQCALANPFVRDLIAQDNHGFLLTVDIAKDLSAAQEDDAAAAVVARLRQAADSLERAVPGLRALVGGEHLILTEIIADMKHDLELGEFISLPVALVVMVLVFAGFLAAAMPVVGALASILACMGAIFAATYVADVHTSVINVISLVGLGLSIDYGLLAVSRFREEARRLGAAGPAGGSGPDGPANLGGPGGPSGPAAVKATVEAAVAATVASAGRTVFYSALTIALCIAGLMAFEPSILKTFGLAGMLVVLAALGAATTLVPALLVLAGRFLIRPSWLSRAPVLSRLYARVSDVSPDVGVFSRLATAVQRHPWWVMGAVLAVLTVLALPIRDLELRNSTVEMLPQNSEQRTFLAELADNYPLSGVDAIGIVSLGSQPDTERFAQDKLGSIPGTRLEASPDAIADGLPEGTAAVQRDGYVEVILAVTADDPEGPEARAAVERIRSLAPADFAIYVTGPAARLLDYQEQLARGAPWAAVIVVLAAFVLLFLFTGSLLIPLKALITNALSLAACLGAVTWVFQGGHLGGLLGFSAVAGLESYIVVLLAIFGFGLAMDYEVFLISRIKESWDANHDPKLSVSQGLQHSGRIITSAAL